MLLNGKIEELKKYSKGTYNKEAFVQAIKDRWELTDLQIRMTYLISDLAVKACGAFSVTHQNFIKMFKERFKMEVSLSSVRRFFGLLSKIGVLSINGAKRKNNQQSANIYIVEVCETEEQPYEHRHEHLEEQAVEQHNITINKTINKTFNIPLNNLDNKIVNKENNYDYKQELENEIIYKLVTEYMSKGLNKLLCLNVVHEVNNSKWRNKESIENYGAYLRSCLEKALEKVEVKIGKRESNFSKFIKNRSEDNESTVPFYNWQEEVK